VISERDYQRIPPACRNGLIRFILFGDEVGDFLYQILSNNLVEAAGRADHLNIEILHVYAGFLYNVAPRSSWGTQNVVECWMGFRDMRYHWESVSWPKAWVEEVEKEWNARPSEKPIQ
jgi:hypothetical protein